MTEDEVLQAIRELVATGEYLDTMLGVPGARLSGGGAFQGNQRMYVRGSPEYLEARAAGLIEMLPPLTPATLEAVQAAERDFGYPLPSLLRRLYLEVANGGFGPGYGLFRLPLAANEWKPEWWPDMPPSLLPLCHWGCAIHSFVDCAGGEAAMWGWDPNPAPDDDIGKALFREQGTLREWLTRWLGGRLWQPVLVEDPVTGEWRGATDLEKAAWMAEC
jgi:SMI1/KNR4 family protein SUKH-1